MVSAPGPGPAGHGAGPGRSRGGCSRCRRDALVAQVTAADRSLAPAQVAAAVDAAAGTVQALRSLAAALAGRTARDVLTDGAPPGVGRLVTELIARGSAEFTAPACKSCGTTGRPLTRSSAGGVCPRCRNRLLAVACSRCGGVKPVAGRTEAGEPACERCRRHERGHRPCGTCGKTAPIAVRGRGGHADVCVNCYRIPQALCTACGRRRPCNFASGHPVCKTCAPRAASICARCGLDRPPAARWPEGPVCDTCYTSALRRRGACTACGQQRRLIAPPGPGAIMCADCAGLPLSHVCALCGVEDKLFEKGRCARCSLRDRASDLLAGAGADAIPGLTAVAGAITAARNPYSALNWLRTSGSAAILAEIAAGRTALTHQALDDHPDRRAADYLRHMLTAGAALPARDEALARVELWSREVLDAISEPADRRLVQAYLTWQVLQRLRRRSRTSPGARTVTSGARHQVLAVVAFLVLPDTENADVGGVHDADEKPGNSGGVVGEVPGSVGEVPD